MKANKNIKKLKDVASCNYIIEFDPIFYCYII